MAFPINRQVSWTPNPDPSGGIPTSYEVSVDGVVVGTPTGLSQIVTFPTTGVYTVEVKAVNVYGVSAPATIVEIAQAPGAPVDVNIDNVP